MNNELGRQIGNIKDHVLGTTTGDYLRRAALIGLAAAGCNLASNSQSSEHLILGSALDVASSTPTPNNIVGTQTALEQQMNNLGLTMTALVSTPTSMPTNTETPVPQLTENIGNPTVAAMIATLEAKNPTQEATALSAEAQSIILASREQAVGKTEITAWDGASSIKSGITLADFELSINSLSKLQAQEVISTGDVRTYDLQREIAGLSNNIIRMSKSDGTFPKAEEVASELQTEAEFILTGRLGFKNPTKDQINELANTLLTRSFGVSADRKTLYTENTYTGPVPAGTLRKDQQEEKICSLYDENTKIGQETIQDEDGNLHLSNQAPLAMTMVITDESVLNKVKDPSLYDTMRIQNSDGKWQTLTWIWQDLGSEPANSLFGFVNTPIPADSVWGSTITKPCGQARVIPIVPAEQMAAQPAGNVPENPVTVTTPPEKGPDPFNNGQNDGSDMQNRDNRGTGGGAENADTPAEATALAETGQGEHKIQPNIIYNWKKYSIKKNN
jgi:hypothetical protein